MLLIILSIAVDAVAALVTVQKRVSSGNLGISAVRGYSIDDHLFVTSDPFFRYR